MTGELGTLILAAASIGFFHTLLGPDHYLPFVMMSWARGWSVGKTSVITLLCGVGHIASSVVLGVIGVSIGLGVGMLEVLESVRGNVAAWLLIGFGFAYLVWGLRRAYRNRPHVHSHGHVQAGGHEHPHKHLGEHSHVHEKEGKANITPWALFVVFVFGPCEPLIPILMYPAAKHSFSGLIIVTFVFGSVTLATMWGAVLLGCRGAQFGVLKPVQRFAHVIAGAAICLCGLAIQLLGL